MLLLLLRHPQIEICCTATTSNQSISIQMSAVGVLYSINKNKNGQPLSYLKVVNPKILFYV